MDALQLAKITVRFGGLVAVDDLSLNVREGAIHSLIGPNGAGKSTVINSITGLYRPTAGKVLIFQEEVSGKRPDEICRLGISRTFQNTQLFSEMTVLENVLVGAHTRARYGIVQSVFHLSQYWTEERLTRQRASELLDMVGLLPDAATSAGGLPFGKQRQLEIARALASCPKVLLLDEPAAGLRAAEIDRLNQILLKLREGYGVTILLVDHVMKVVMNISDYVTVLNFGRKIAEGTPETVRADLEVKRAYLGEQVKRARTH